MQIIEAILFEPVGCLAEFPAEPLHEIAVRLFQRRKKPGKSGSRSYWHLLNLIEAADKEFDASERKAFEDLEVQAVAGATIYEDVVPSLREMKAMGVKLIVASSLSNLAIACFLEKCSPYDFFSSVWTRNNAGGIKSAPLRSAVCGASLRPENTMFLTDTVEGLKVAKS